MYLLGNELVGKLIFDLGSVCNVDVKYSNGVEDDGSVFEEVKLGLDDVTYILESHNNGKYFTEGLYYEPKTEGNLICERIELSNNGIDFKKVDLNRIIKIENKNGYYDFVVFVEAYDNSIDIFDRFEQESLKEISYNLGDNPCAAKILYNFIKNNNLKFEHEESYCIVK